MKLSEIKKGEAFITRITATGKIAERLSRLGVVKGAKCSVLRKGIKGDPIEIKILGYRLAIRRSVAERIEVETI